MEIYMFENRPEEALPLRFAPPSRAWLAACQRCRGPEILFAFCDDLSVEAAPDCSALASLLRKLQSRGSQRVISGGRVLVIQDGPELPNEPNKEVFIYLDRQHYAITQRVQIGPPAARRAPPAPRRIMDFYSPHRDNRVSSSPMMRSRLLDKIDVFRRANFPLAETEGIGRRFHSLKDSSRSLG